ncbi:hypothetical protein HOLleu_35364 [Holothuria leucospilota]|uniref:Uncharacterized protein n=1 Tax=Holothuria leucospilota TaxID=206669 RepID=A0A9Q1BHB3_HOLLE|nr:hypothetical protein HOLleu_35364 [Holothuria leucospilota]
MLMIYLLRDLSRNDLKQIDVNTGILQTNATQMSTFSVLLVVYIASGIGYAKYKGRTGKEMIPNYSFWSDLPYAIKDGFKFSISLVRGKSYTPSTSAKAKPSAYGSM